MPPRKKAAQTLSAHIDESSDEDAGFEEAPPKKIPAKRAPRKASATSAVAGEKAARGKKKKPVAPIEDDEEVDDPIEDDEDIEDTVVLNDAIGVETKKKGRKTLAKPEPIRKEPTKGGRGKKAVAEDDDDEEEPEEAEGEAAVDEEPKAVKRGGKKSAATTEIKDAPATLASEKKKRMTKKEKDAAAKEEAEKEIAETQFTPMEVDQPSDETEELEIAPTPTQVHQAGMGKVTAGKKATVGAVKGKGKGKKVEQSATEDEVHTEEDDLAKPTKVAVPAAPPGRGKGKRQASSGDGEKGGEALRDLERAYKELQIRYDKLQQAKETEPERVLKEFQRNMKEKDEARNKFISTLQDDLKAQQSLSGESKALQKKLVAKETEVTKLQAKVQELNKNLQDQQNESQVMSAKLAQAQHQLAQAQQSQRNSAQVPGSAVKPGHRGPLGNPKANLSTAADDAKLKEDLYADLCGLIIVNVKKENDSNVFECLQTGVNGLAFHFKLSVPNQHTRSKKALGTQESKDPADADETDENEVIFIPLLDKVRDRSVIDLLPTYLRDEISFQRDHMTKFYQKINSLFMMTISTQQQASDSTEEEEETDEEEEEEEEGEEEEDDDMEVEEK